MRGLVSILLVVLLLVQVLVFMSAYARHRSEIMVSANDALILEKNYYLEMDVKHTLVNSIRIAASGSNGNREETADAVAERLAEFENFVEGERASEEGVEIDLWCGIADEHELDALADKMLENKKLEKCTNCFDFSDMRVRVRGKKISSVRKCTAFLNPDTLTRAVFVSRGGADLVSDADVVSAWNSGEYVIGFSILNKKFGIASVAVIPEGTRVEY